jgi:hypothetical protein
MYPYGMFIKAFKTTHFIFLSIYRSLMSILPSHKCLCLSSGYFSHVFLNKKLHKEHEIYVLSLEYFSPGRSFPIPTSHRQHHLAQNQQFANGSTQ